MPVAARALLGLAGAVFFSGGRAFKRKTSQLRSRLEEGFRGRPRRLIVRTALLRRHSPDSRQIVIASAKILFFDFDFPRCSEVPAVERRRLTLGIADEKAHAVSGGPLFDIFCVDQFRS